MQEIFLGVKRQARPGRLLRRLLLALGLVAAALTIAYIVFRKATGASPPAGSLPAAPLVADGSRLTWAGSSLERTGDLWVLRATGEPYVIGAAQARLLGLTHGDALADDVTGRGWLGRFAHELDVRWRYRRLVDGLGAAARAEVAGFAAAAGTPYQRLAWGQAGLDLGRGAAASLAFVASGAGPLGNRVVVGRAFALAGAAPPPLVSFVHPAGKLAFARVGWPGEIGVVTGVNVESIAVVVAPAVTDDVHPDAAPPVALLAREVLERAHSLDEAVALIQGTRTLGAAAFLVVDGKAGTWAVVERTPGRAVAQKPAKPPLVGDVLESAELAKDAENDRARRTRPGLARAERLAEIFGRGIPPEPAAVAAVLRDRRARGEVRLPLGSGAAIDDLAQQHVAIIDVTALALWVGEGPGAAGALRAFDLRHELGGEAPRAGAQASLPPEAGADLLAARAVVLAREDVAAGVSAARLGRWGDAADDAARALALAPDLPPAHKLAADAARARGDGAAATDHYRRYLELGPADPVAEREARAYLGTP